jgi:DNA invertase Pin-like site-specific DNA recombinase
MPRTTKRTAILLTRVSTGNQAESGLGLEAQLASMATYCADKGIKVLGTYEDAGVGGRAPLDKRHGLLAALAAVEGEGASMLLCAKRDRVSRDPFTILSVERALKKVGARLVSAAGEGTEEEGPEFVFMRRILDALAEMEASLVSARTKAALRAKKARNEWIGRPPKGFTCIDGKLTRADDWADVARCLEMRKQGHTHQAIANELGWQRSFVSRILRKWKKPGSFRAFTLLAATKDEISTTL